MAYKQQFISLSLTVLEAEKPKIRALADSDEGLLTVHRHVFLLCPHVLEENKGSLSASFLRALIPGPNYFPKA